MKLRLFVFGALALCLVPAASAQACTKGKFRGSAPYVAKRAHADALENKPGLAEVRAELAGFRRNERTCLGQNTIDFAIAMIDVNEAPLQQAVDALPTIFQASVPDYEKTRMMHRLIDRFYTAREYPAAVSLARMAAGKFPESEGFSQKLALLLAFTGQDEEARTIAQLQLDEALQKVPEGTMPFEGWVRYALTDMSGDVEDRQAVLAQLSDHLGRDAGPVVAEFADVSVLAMVMARAFGMEGNGQPIAPPRPSYPMDMARLGHEGICDTYFDVSLEGVPENLIAVCTDPGFADETVRAVSDEVRFAPFVLNGQPKRLVSVTYPLEFKLQ